MTCPNDGESIRKFSGIDLAACHSGSTLRAIDQDATLASRLVYETALISRFIYLPKPIVVNVEEVQLNANVALRIRLKTYVLDTLYEKRFTSDVTLRVLDEFAEHGIKPPKVVVPV